MRISRYRPNMTVLALTPHEDVAGRLMLYWGECSCIIANPATVDKSFELAAKLTKDLGITKSGDLIIIAGHTHRADGSDQHAGSYLQKIEIKGDNFQILNS